MTTYYVDGAVGNDGNAGTSEGAGNAWATIDKAASTVAVSDVVYVKASANYNEQVTIDTPGVSTTTIEFRGYSSTPGDNGKVTIDGQSTRTYCIDGNANMRFYAWHNFIFTNATSRGVFAGTSNDTNAFFNCEFNTNGTDGFLGDNTNLFAFCEFNNNTTFGINADSNNLTVGCVFAGNGEHVALGFTGSSYKCVYYGSSSTTADTVAGSYVNFIGNTVDGEGVSTGDGVNGASSGPCIFADNIIHDVGGDGMGLFPVTTLHFGGYNLFSSVTGDNWTAPAPGGPVTLGEYGDVDGAPAFIDEAGDDYRPSSSSPAVDAQLKPGGLT